MKKMNETFISSLEDLIELILIIEDLIKITRELCLSKEMLSIYYDLDKDRSHKISEERNIYINTLNIAIEKIAHVKSINEKFEQVFCELKQDTNNCGR